MTKDEYNNLIESVEIKYQQAISNAQKERAENLKALNVVFSLSQHIEYPPKYIIKKEKIEEIIFLFGSEIFTTRMIRESWNKKVNSNLRKSTLCTYLKKLIVEGKIKLVKQGAGARANTYSLVKEK
jgi:hypothetical protein